MKPNLPLAFNEQLQSATIELPQSTSQLLAQKIKQAVNTLLIAASLTSATVYATNSTSDDNQLECFRHTAPISISDNTSEQEEVLQEISCSTFKKNDVVQTPKDNNIMDALLTNANSNSL